MSVPAIESISALPFSVLPLAAWLHDLDPFLIQFTPTLGLRWYGLSYLMGFVAGYFLLRMLAKRGVSSIPIAHVADAILTIVIGVVVGGRLGYVLLYQPSLLTEFSPSLPFWGVLNLTQGGMASHGGMVGIMLAALKISRGYKTETGDGHIERLGKCSPLHVFDLMVLIVPPGLFFGRVANFINGELLGKIVAPPGEPAPWWAVRFPQEILERPNDLVQTPEQLAQIEQLAYSQLFPSENGFYLGYDRLIERVQSGNAELAAKLEPLISARAPSQLLQAVGEGIVVGLVLWFVARKPRLPGLIGGVFLIVYGLQRIATEFVRLADSQFTGTGLLDSARPLGFSRGQWLSMLMVVSGIAMIAWIKRRGGERIGGWRADSAQDSEPTVSSAD